MTVDIHIDWDNETARFDWGAGQYRVVRHRHEGARTVYEVVEPGGRIQRVGGFRSGLTALWWRMARECE